MNEITMTAKGSGRLMAAALLSAGLLLAGSGPAWADRDGHRDHRENRYEMRHDHHEYGRHDGRHERRDHRRQPQVTVVRELPRGYRTVVIDRVPYYFHEHRCYTRGPGGYLLVRPPVGALFATLPFGSVRVTVGGSFFFVAEDVYYRPSPRGFMVVAPPVAAAPVHSGAVIVRTSALNVRSGPGEGFPVVGRVWRGDTLHVSGQAPGWYRVHLPDGGSGWVMSGYTTLAAG